MEQPSLILFGTGRSFWKQTRTGDWIILSQQQPGELSSQCNLNNSPAVSLFYTRFFSINRQLNIWSILSSFLLMLSAFSEHWLLCASFCFKPLCILSASFLTANQYFLELPGLESGARMWSDPAHHGWGKLSPRPEVSILFHLDKDSAAGLVNHCTWERSHRNRPDLFLQSP